MTAASDRRLEKIAAALTPKEAVLVWMAEAHACGSIQDYVGTLRDAPEDAFPLMRLSREMEQAARAVMPRKPEAEIWRAVRLAVRDAGFLYYLVSHVNFRVLQQRRANWLHILLVSEMLHSAIERESDEQLARWWDQAREAASAAYVQDGAGMELGRRYFVGASPLFPDAAEDVAAQVTEIERLIEMFNDHLQAAMRRRSKRRAASVQPIDLAQLRAQAERAIHAEVALTVDLAKAQAWELIGEREKGYPLVERHVWGEGG